MSSLSKNVYRTAGKVGKRGRKRTNGLKRFGVVKEKYSKI